MKLIPGWLCISILQSLLYLCKVDCFKLISKKNLQPGRCLIDKSNLYSLTVSMAQGCDAKIAMSPSPRALIIVGANAPSYFRTKPNQDIVTWKDAFDKISAKATWEKWNNKYDMLNGDQELSVKVITTQELLHSNSSLQYISSSGIPPVVIFAGIRFDSSYTDKAVLLTLLKDVAEKATAVTTYDCEPSISVLTKYGKGDNQYLAELVPNENQPSILQRIQIWLKRRFLSAEELKLLQRQTLARKISEDMWTRQSVEDLLFMVFVLIDAFTDYPIKSVTSVTSTEATSFKQVTCMAKNCKDEILACMADENCRKALACLNNCRGNDQVCSYRCIVSYESPAFEKFANCILQRHNCMGNSATIPKYPNPQEMQFFRGKPLDFDTAEDIFIGHLRLPSTISSQEMTPLLASVSSNFSNEGSESDSLLPWSWKVVCGQNPAYDYFACQHQLFYRENVPINRTSGISNNDSTISNQAIDKQSTKDFKTIFWYDPVFQVTTLDGKVVWRRRHYRVRRGKVPGQFYFSVIDNGVASNEFWKILDCADDLSWAVFHYCGAASAAGTSYTGSLIVSKDGRWPEMTNATSQRIHDALSLAQIDTWELFEVRNENCCGSGVTTGIAPPPLGIPYKADNEI